VLYFRSDDLSEIQAEVFRCAAARGPATAPPPPPPPPPPPVTRWRPSRERRGAP